MTLLKARMLIEIDFFFDFGTLNNYKLNKALPFQFFFFLYTAIFVLKYNGT